jgi:hypothetical protein
MRHPTDLHRRSMQPHRNENFFILIPQLLQYHRSFVPQNMLLVIPAIALKGVVSAVVCVLGAISFSCCLVKCEERRRSAMGTYPSLCTGQGPTTLTSGVVPMGNCIMGTRDQTEKLQAFMLGRQVEAAENLKMAKLVTVIAHQTTSVTPTATTVVQTQASTVVVNGQMLTQFRAVPICTVIS